MSKRREPLVIWRFKRNNDWRASARVGVVTGLWFFPTSLFLNLIEPMRNLAMLSGLWVLGLLNIGMVLMGVVLGHITLFICGIAGFVTETVVSSQALKCHPKE